MHNQTVRIPMRISLYILGFIFFAAGGVGMLYASLFGDLSNERVDINGLHGRAEILEVVFQFIPANITFIIFGLLCLLCAVFLFGKIVRKNEGIVLSPEGIIVNVAISKTGLIPWNEVKSVEIVPYGHQKNVAINLFAPTPFMNKQKPTVRFMLFLNKLLGMDYPILFTAKAVKMKLPELMRMIEEYRQNYSNQPSAAERG